MTLFTEKKFFFSSNSESFLYHLVLALYEFFKFTLPAAPSSTLAASERPSLALVRSPAAAAVVAAHRSPSPLVVGGGGWIRARILSRAGSVAAGRIATAAAVAGPVWADLV